MRDTLFFPSCLLPLASCLLPLASCLLPLPCSLIPAPCLTRVGFLHLGPAPPPTPDRSGADQKERKRKTTKK
ncbi:MULTISPECIES: hypothetical protein [unclassified Moorena]|uniref:hypothetical protein n=1 Tax=unclassified Moorena TaxID=2683338 RepID=UPI0013FFA62A|nr:MULTISPECIES: hypothetical protein [unclassified Moorena]NEO11485.1 hypothetical protein [Moorena sp. SIO3E8]NEP97945.1 hypothetical protein [Moorena sp. SIO3F7]